jgi:hypothetical protein
VLREQFGGGKTFIQSHRRNTTKCTVNVRQSFLPSALVSLVKGEARLPGGLRKEEKV